MSTSHSVAEVRFEPLAPDSDHNRALGAALHPPDWRNPTPKPRYDLVVVGGGTAGLVTAAGAAGLGARVALVERELLGGDCLVTGCVPSKALVRAARAAHEARRGARFGIHAEQLRVDFPAVMERVRAERAAIAPHDSAERFQGLGIDVFLGEGRFVSPTALDVAGTELRFKRACIATGSRAVVPNVPGLRALFDTRLEDTRAGRARVLTHTGIFSLTELPARLVVIGGGPIGCELAQAFARLGSRVTLVQRGESLLEKDHPDAGLRVRAALEEDGVDVRTASELQRIERSGADLELTVRSSKNEASVDSTLRADVVLVAAGRQPNVEGLGLESAGVSSDPRAGVTVDDRLRTSTSRIFAAGDCASRFQFTHMADALARIVIRNALFFGRAKASALTVPWVTYTDPEVAATGLSLAAARAAGHDDARTTRIELESVDRARLDGERAGFLEVVHTRKGKLLGGTLVAAHAGESISELTLAITRGLELGHLADVIHPYPTVAEAFRKAGDAFNRTKLTPFAARVLRWIARC